MIRIQNPKQCVRLRPVGATVILSKNPGLGTKIIELKFLLNYEGAGKKYCWLFRMAKGYSRANFVKRGRGGKETPNFTDWCFSEVPKSHWRLLVGTIMRPNIKVWSCEHYLYIIWLVADVFFALGGSHWSEVVNVQDTQSNWRQRIFAGVSVKYGGRALEDRRVWVMVPRRWDRRSAREDVRERDSEAMGNAVGRVDQLHRACLGNCHWVIRRPPTTLSSYQLHTTPPNLPCTLHIMHNERLPSAHMRALGNRHWALSCR